MVSLLPTAAEQQLQYAMVDEALQLYGLECQLYAVLTSTRHRDERTLAPPRPYRLLLQDYIDRQLLRGIYRAHADWKEQGQVAYAPRYLAGQEYVLERLQVLELHNGDLWQIADLSQPYLVGVWYVLHLVPYVPEPNRPRDPQQLRSNYLHSDRLELP